MFSTALTNHNRRLTVVITMALFFLQHGAEVYPVQYFFSKSVVDKLLIQFRLYFFHSLEMTKQNHINQPFLWGSQFIVLPVSQNLSLHFGVRTASWHLKTEATELPSSCV